MKRVCCWCTFIFVFMIFMVLITACGQNSIDNNLNEVFLAWNSKYNPGQVFTFMASAYNENPGCVTGFAG